MVMLGSRLLMLRIGELYGLTGTATDTTSGNVKSIWCEDGYLIAYDPSWIFTDLYSS